MKLSVKQSSLVRPADETPRRRRRLWLSNLDQMFVRMDHVSLVFPYTNNGSPNFFDFRLLEESLAKALVHFFPMAGRLAREGDTSSGRFELDCNGQGVLFREAEIDVPMSEFGEFQPSPLLNQFVPTVDYSRGFSSFPLLLLQVTRFRCGGVCLGIGHHHVVCDGSGLTNFLAAWSNLARGDSSIPLEPLVDRTILMAQFLPTSTLDHPEYEQIEQPTSADQQPTSAQMLSLPAQKIKDMKENTNNDYSTYELLAAHVWRCATVARRFHDPNQRTALHVTIDGRKRFNPPIPAGYFGNCVFFVTATASLAELSSEPFGVTAERVRRAIQKIDEEYMRSAIGHLQLPGDGASKIRVPGSSGSPDLKVISWTRFRIGQDFGWGDSLFTRSSSPKEGKCHILPLDGDGEVGISISICLEVEAMKKFKELFTSGPITQPRLLSHM